MMRKTRLVSVLLICVLGGCMTEVEGDPGAQGPPGEPGPVTGLGLVWKDSSGTIVPNAFPLYQDRKFVMVVRDEKGVFFDVSPMSGTFNYMDVTTNGVTFYLTSNCSGPPHYLVDIAPNMAFQFDGRIVALPPDITVTTLARSFSGSTGCHPQDYVAPYISSEAIDDLSTLTPPTLRPGPYHVDQR